MTLNAIASVVVAHRSHAEVWTVSALGGGLEIRPTFLRIAEGLSHGTPRRHAQRPTLPALGRARPSGAPFALRHGGRF